MHTIFIVKISNRIESPGSIIQGVLSLLLLYAQHCFRDKKIPSPGCTYVLRTFRTLR